MGERLRRFVLPAVAAAVVAGDGLPLASAAGPDRPDTLQAAASAAASPTGKWIRESLSSTSDVDWFRFTVKKRSWGIVTLGHLPANYSLAVFDAHGTQVAASDQPGKAFEQVYRRFDAGDYFVRVASTSGADRSVAYAVKFRVLPAAMIVAEHRNVGDVDGYDIKGELLNNTASWRNVLRVHVVWLDKNGHKLGSHDEGVVPGPVAPRQRVEFDVVAERGTSALPAGTSAYRLHVDSQKTTARTPSGLGVTPTKQTTTKTQRLYDGTVKNTSSKTIRGIYPTVIEYDAWGRAIAFGFDNLGRLAPGQSRSYEAVIDTAKLPKPNSTRTFASITES